MSQQQLARAAARVRQLLPSPADYAGLRQSWGIDLLAGLTVGIVALPLALAFGVASGAGAEAGLVTAIVAAVFGGSNVQVSGPTGAMVVVLAPIIAEHGPAVSPIVSLAAGVLVLAAGLARFGRVVGTIPWPVIEGFTLGIAIIIFLQQVPSAVGADGGESTNALVAAVVAVGNVNWPATAATLILVAVVAVCMLLAPKVHPRIPGSLVGVIAATVLAAALGLPVATIGALPAGLPAPSFPEVDVGLLGALAGPIVAVAALAAIESLLSARVASAIADTGPYDPDRELVGQGLASVAAGCFGGMPATGAIARTAVNVRAGARTRLAAVVHALLLLVVVLVGASLVVRIPLAALAGVLLVTSTKMITPATVRTVLRSSRADAVVFILTALITVSLDLIYAVLIGSAVAVIFALRTLSRARGIHREELPGKAVAGDERIALFRLEGALFFGTAERILERVSQMRGVEVVVLRMSQLQILDSTGAQVLAELVQALDRRGVTVLVKGIRPAHLPLATRVGLIGALRHPRHLFEELAPAVEHARSHVRRGA